MKKLFLGFAAAFFILLPSITHAASTLIINEFMYDAPGTDTGHEWVEVYNAGAASVTMVGGSAKGGWRFSDGSNHLLAATAAQGSMTIAPGGYLILADDPATFLSDNPGFSGSLVDTTISLANSGGTAKIIDGDGNVVDTVTYASSQGASGDGNTLQRTFAGAWITALPTPGAANATSAQPPVVASDDTQTASTSTTTTTGTTNTADTSTTVVGSGIAAADVPPGSVASQLPTMQATLTSPIEATAGIPISISATVFGYEGEYRQGGSFHYALGDGTENLSHTPAAFKHAYAFPGTYAITFEYRTDAFMPDPEITVTREIEVVASPITIAAVNPDGSIELKNGSDDQADISDWALASLNDPAATEFVFPEGTIVLAGKSITLPTAVTGFAPRDEATLGFMLPSGKVAATYGGQALGIMPPQIVQTAQTDPPILPAAPAPAAPKTPEINTVEEILPAAAENTASIAPTAPAQIPAAGADISATAIDAFPQTKTPAKSSASFWPFIIGLAGVVGIGAYLIARFRPENPLADAEAFAPSDTQTIADSVRILEE